MCRIVVPTSLRRIIFNLMHATPVTGHIGEYKTLYHVKLRFVLHRLRSDLSDRVKQCLHFMLTYRWH